MGIPADHMPWDWLVKVMERGRKSTFLVGVNYKPQVRVRAGTAAKAVRLGLHPGASLRGARVTVVKID